MKVNPQIPKLSFRYGAVGGVLAIIAFLVFHYLGLPPGSFISFIVTALIVGMFSFLPMKDFKSNVNDGEFRFYHGMTIGFISYLAIATLYSLFYLLFIELIEPEYLNSKIEYVRETLIAQKDEKIKEFGEDVYNRQLEGLETISTSTEVLSEFAKRLLFGIFLTPIFSIVLRTRQT